MYLTLSIFAGIVGLAVTAAAVYTIWLVEEQHKKAIAENPDVSLSRSALAGRYLMQWTIMDYAMLAIFAFGTLFLFVDIVGVIRDRNSYPFYHYGYLLSGFVFMLIGMLFMLTRLAVVLRVLQGAGLSPVDHHHKPDQAHKAE